MSTKLSVWIDNPTNENTQDATTFAADSQRASGFVTGTPASSKRMNTALRQANLVAVALMDLIAPNSDVTAQSSLTQMKDAIQAYLNNLATKEDVQASKITTKQVKIPETAWGYNSDGDYVASVVVEGVNTSSVVLVDIDVIETMKLGGGIDNLLSFWSDIYATRTEQNAIVFYKQSSGGTKYDIIANVMVVT